jgi:hypothetical protein
MAKAKRPTAKSKKLTQLDRIERAGNQPQTVLPAEGETQLDRIEPAINGNGREGLLSRAARLETLMLSSTENSLRNSTAIAALGDKMHETNDSLGAHCKTTHLDGLIRKTKFWVAIFAALVGFNLISRYIPGAITLLFQLLGVPGVHVPLE